MEDEIISLESLADFFQNSINLPELRNSLSLGLGNDVVDTIYIGEACHYDTENGFLLSAYIGIPINIELGIPTSNLLKIKLGLPNQQIVVSKFFFFFNLIDNSPKWRISLKNINITIVFDKSVLRKVDLVNAEPMGSEISVKTGISFDQNSNIFIDPAETSLPLSYIGSSNFKISAEKVRFNLKPNNPEVSLRELKFIPPQDLFPDDLAMPAFSIKNALVNKNGFTGTVEMAWNLNYENNQFLIDIENENGLIERKASNLFSIPGGINYFKIQFENNIPIASEIKGLIRIPYFNQDIAVSIVLDEFGNFKVILDGLNPEGILLTKEDLVSMYLRSLTIDQASSSISISGGLEPLLYQSQGMKWPRMDVNNLNIDSTGKFSIDEAWLNLNELATLDLFGFKLELRKIGLGTTEENNSNKLWIDLSGGLKLIEQIPIGVDVEGFRILWPQNKTIQEFTPNDIGIQFKGVQLSFGVPGAIQLDGLLRFIKDENVTAFAGDMVLVLPAVGITAEAGLLVGMNSEQPNPYPFFYVYFGLEAAAGIPLGQSGLALKGAMGLFGINVAPNRQEGQNWYYDWYKKAPAPGAHQTTKWTNERDALAVGAGVTITTIDGIVKGTKGIIVLALPGPILVINGKALILDGLNPNPNAEPPFSATAIFDGKEKMVQFNIEAQAEIVEDIVEAYAAVEAFFDFKDITNWHVYLGQDEPKDRRIRANILNIIEADAFLMLDMLDADSPRARMGVEASIKPKIDNICFDIPFAREQCIKFYAHVNIGGKGEVSIQPEQFSGSGFIDAGIGISALGIELEIGAEVDVSVEGPSPFSLQGNLKLYADLPNPLPDYEDTFHVELKIPKVDIEVNNPLVEVTYFSRFTTQSKRSKIYSNRINYDILTGNDEEGNLIAPLVECDTNPILAFEHEMNQSIPFLMPPEGIKKYNVGALEISPKLTKVIIREKEKKNNAAWKDIYSSISSDNKPIIGTWLAESDPTTASRPASRRLQLLTLNPLSNTMHSTGTTGYLMMQTEAESKHLSELILEDFPELICKKTDVKPHCLDFKFSGKPIISNKINWAKLKFLSENTIRISNNCLTTDKEITIIFPESVYSVTISYCNKPTKVEFKSLTIIKGDELNQLLQENKQLKKTINFDYTKEVEIELINTIDNTTQTIKTKTSFECLKIYTNDKEGLNIKSICYITLKEKENSIENKKRCESNLAIINNTTTNQQTSNPFVNNSIFRPGMYYEIEVQTNLDIVLMSDRIKEENEIVKNNIIDQYYSCIEKIPKSSTSFTYFQTDAPPQNLVPYIKWTLPAMQEKYAYINEPIHIRFKRGYLQTLLGNNVLPEYRMKVYLKDSNGNIDLITEGISWSSSGSATLFPDEETWNNYLSDNRLPTPTKKDALLTLNLKKSNYKIDGRYELLFVGLLRNDINSDELASKNKVVKINGSYHNLLASIPFKTSRFNSFLTLLNSSQPAEQVEMNNNIPTITLVPKIENGIETNINYNFDDLVNAEISYYKGLVDYDYGILQLQKNGITLLSKEALEELKLLHRIQKDKLDEAFRNCALTLNPDLLLRNEGERLSISVITQNSKIVYLWIKLPEAIHYKFNQNALGTHTIRLKKMNNLNSAESEIDFNLLCNSDTTQLILKLKQPIGVESLNTFKVEFTKIKDHQDDISNANFFGPNKNTHHRYDRPSIKSMNKEIVYVIMKIP